MTREARHDTHYARPEDVEEFVRVLESFERGEISAADYRSYRLTRGVYGQRQPDVQMIRVKLPGGIMSAESLRVAADVAETFTTGKLGHITTRQNIQFHNVAPNDVATALARFAAAGVTTVGACGNTVRNITACPFAGVSPTEPFDVTPYMQATIRLCLHAEWATLLPRKFKVAFEGCTHADHAQTAINDIGLRAKVRGGVRGFEVFVAGGLSTSPKPGTRLHEFMPADELLGRVEAIVRLFGRLGNRTNRARARLKYVLKKLKLEGFIAAYEDEVEKIRAQGRLVNAIELPTDESAPAAKPKALAGPRALEGDVDYRAWLRCVDPQRQSGFATVTVKLHRGDVSSDQFRALAEIVETFSDGTLRTGNRQNLMIRWVRTATLPHLYIALLRIGLADAGANTIHDIVSCPGATTCNLAVTSSMSLASNLTRVLKNPKSERRAASIEAARDLDIKISGCPNSCGQHHVGAIGFHGTVRHIGGGRQVPEYQLHLGGGFDADGVRFGRQIVKIPAQRAGDALLALLDLFHDERDEHEGPRAFFSRISKPEVVAALGDIVLRSDFSNMRDQDLRDLDTTDAFAVAIGDGECAA